MIPIELEIMRSVIYLSRMVIFHRRHSRVKLPEGKHQKYGDIIDK
jgi:hypothetical protein